jgi:hypothetical protein
MGAVADGAFPFLAVVLVGLAALQVEDEALQVLLQDDVHDARDGFRAIYRGCAAGDRFDALDHRRRNRVQVDGIGLKIAREMPPSVDEHQRARVTDAAQVDSLLARVEQRRRGVLIARRSERLRQVVERVAELRVAAAGERIAADHGDRHRIVEAVRPLHARAGDQNFLEGCAGLRAGLLGARRRVDTKQTEPGHAEHESVTHDGSSLIPSGRE